MNSRRFPSISGSTLKMTAIICMLIDHTAAATVRQLAAVLPSSMETLRPVLNDAYTVMRAIGRIAFPIFCFLLVEGFFHTRSAVRYALRLFVFALISEIPFDFALGSTLFARHHQNVYFTLLIGLLVMMGVSYIERLQLRGRAADYLKLLMEAAVAVAGLYLAKVMYTDYGFKGVFLIEVLFFLHLDRRVQAVFGALAISWETWAPLSFIPIWFYNGQRGRQMKYFFYWFYPVHLIVLGFLKAALTGSFPPLS